MPAAFINLLDLPELEIGHSKKVLFTSDHFHTWVHGDYPETKGPMHKHTADQQFYCVRRVHLSLSRRLFTTADTGHAGDDSGRATLSTRQYWRRVHDSPRRTGGGGGQATLHRR
jgi:hypothetical protein